MSGLDIVIIALLLFGLVRGFMKGLVMELAKIVSVVIGLWLSIQFSSFTYQYIISHYEVTGNYIKPAAFIITFLIFALLLTIAAKLLDKALRTIGLGILLKLGGAVVGTLKYSIIIGSILYALVYANTRTQGQLLDETFITESKLAPPTIAIAKQLLPLEKISI
jgi:membrane protein required for colicin V production